MAQLPNQKLKNYQIEYRIMSENLLQMLLNEFLELSNGLDQLRGIFKKIVVRLQTALGIQIKEEQKSVAQANVDLTPVYEEQRKLALAIKALDKKVASLMALRQTASAELPESIKEEILSAIDIIKKWSREMDKMKQEIAQILADLRRVKGE